MNATYTTAAPRSASLTWGIMGLLIMGLYRVALVQAEVSSTSMPLGPFEFQDSGTRFGFSIALRDLTGDGVADIVVGAPFQDTGVGASGFGPPQNTGKVFVVRGGMWSVMRSLEDVTFQQNPGHKFGGQFGRVAALGDITGDGIADLLVGAHEKEIEFEVDEREVELDIAGEARVFDGAHGDLLHTLNGPTPEAFAKFGYSVAGLSDTNGDGVADFVVSAPFKDVNGPANAGEVYVYQFNGGDGRLLHTWHAPTITAGARFGYFVAEAGDVNGDGLSDVLIGAPGQNRAFVFNGRTGHVLRTFTNPTSQRDGFFGGAGTGGKDVNGDGIPDLVIAAPCLADDGRALQGAVFVFDGATGTLLRRLMNPATQGFAQFGFAVALTSDMDADGKADILVGAPDQDVNGVTNVGQAFLFSGATGSLLLTLNNPTPQSFAGFGTSVAAGDVNGDGAPDLVVGAPFQDVPHPEEGDLHLDQGQVFIFLSYGSAASGVHAGAD
jgi:FG-GAP repeat/FG-GAP-like repeat